LVSTYYGLFRPNVVPWLTMTEFSAWLDGTARTVFAICATLFVMLNAGAIALVSAKRDRGIVNRWTARWLAVNLALIGAGLGVPVAAMLTRITIDAFAVARGVQLPADQEPEQQATQTTPPPR
jgi:hypothetical protein